MTPEELQTPPTEIELGKLTVACSKVLTPAGMNILRRLAFAYGSLQTRLKEAENLIGELTEDANRCPVCCGDIRECYCTKN